MESHFDPESYIGKLKPEERAALFNHIMKISVSAKSPERTLLDTDPKAPMTDSGEKMSDKPESGSAAMPTVAKSAGLLTYEPGENAYNLLRERNWTEAKTKIEDDSELKSKSSLQKQYLLQRLFELNDKSLVLEAFEAGIFSLNEFYDDRTTCLMQLGKQFYSNTASRLDDSSADEIEEPVISEENFWAQYAKFIKNAAFTCTKSSNSFISHYFGKNLLKLRSIKERYHNALTVDIPETENFATLFTRLYEQGVAKLSLHLKTGESLDTTSTIQLALIILGLLERDNLKGIRKYKVDIESEKRRTHLIYDAMHDKLNTGPSTRDKDKLSEEFKKAVFVSKFVDEIRDIVKTSLMRTSLPTSTTLIVRDQRDFLAALNLSMRSSKRYVRNIQDIRFTEAVDIHNPINFAFDDSHIVTEEQVYTHGAKHERTRKDLVAHFGTYKDIVARIKYFGLNKDEMKAKWAALLAQKIREIITFANKDTWIVKYPDPRINKAYQDFCFQLAYLLFGCEATRNPAALLHNMMLLDLIEAGVYPSWEEALIDKMPMSIVADTSGTVCAAARYLHQEYGHYLTEYEYHGKALTGATGHPTAGQKPMVNRLISREQAIVADWLKHKKCKKDAKGNYVGSFDLIWQEITNNWFKGCFSASPAKLFNVSLALRMSAIKLSDEPEPSPASR